MSLPVALTIAGSDPSGGAGIQADLKVFHQHKVYGTSVITLLTVQNTCTVESVHYVEADLVGAQLNAVTSDLQVAAAKTGALGNAEIIKKVAELAAEFVFPLVIDPVMISKHGLPLIDDSAVEVLAKKLLPHAFLVTPNLNEAARLCQISELTDIEGMKKAALQIAAMGAKNVLVKGGHLKQTSCDVLLSNKEFHFFDSERIETKNTHGTGCVFSSAITAELARGNTLLQAVTRAKDFVTLAIKTNPSLGHGAGPTNMLAEI